MLMGKEQTAQMVGHQNHQCAQQSGDQPCRVHGEDGAPIGKGLCVGVHELIGAPFQGPCGRKGIPDGLEFIAGVDP